MSLSPTSVADASSDGGDEDVFGEDDVNEQVVQGTPAPPSVPAAQGDAALPATLGDTGLQSPTAPTEVVEPPGRGAVASRIHVAVLARRLHGLVPHAGHHSLAGLALTPERPIVVTGGFNDAGCTGSSPHPTLPRPAAWGGIVPGAAGGGGEQAHDVVFEAHDVVLEALW